MKAEATNADTKSIRTGDTVFHRPTGERWIVAFANEERDELAWVGWPDGHARLSDCELRKSCSDEQSDRLLREIADSSGTGARQRYARRVLSERPPGGPPE